MKASVIKEILAYKGVEYLYHVNTVVTSLTYINNGGLLSRGSVEDAGLLQTPQESDYLDREFDVFYDIFFDSVDIHERAKQTNHYGVIAFEFSIDVLDELDDCDILVTKDNPIRWKSAEDYENNYFTNERDLCDYFFKGNFAQHITIRKPYRPIRFDYLKNIIIETPYEMENKTFNVALESIENALMNNGYNPDLLVFRKCSSDCRCKAEYKNNHPGFTYYRFTTKL